MKSVRGRNNMGRERRACQIENVSAGLGKLGGCSGAPVGIPLLARRTMCRNLSAHANCLRKFASISNSCP
jgi:hypothetical protein